MYSTIEIDSVFKTYDMNKLLTNVYLKCQTGEIIGILGRNGSGKSTLLKILFGTLVANQKTIKIDNKFYNRPYQTKNLVVYLPQHGFLPDHVNLRTIINAYIKKNVNRKTIINNERIKIHLKKKPKELSGGELRYFEILLLINLNAKFILLDEPFSGIEPIYKEMIKELIQKYSSYKGFIITDHDYQNILDISTRVTLIKDGRLINIKKNEELEEHNYLPKGSFIHTEKVDSEEESIPVKFEVDKQTLQDLGLFHNTKKGLIISIFNNTKTTGGEICLQKMLKTPISSIKILKDRRDSIKYFAKENVTLKIEKKDIDFIEFYKTSKISFSRNNVISSIYQSLRYKLKSDSYYFTKKTGVEKTFAFLRYLSVFIKNHQTKDLPWYLSNLLFNTQEILMEKGFREILYSFNEKHIKVTEIDKFDYLFRKTGIDKINEILEMFYELDVFISVANSTKNYSLCFPEYSNSTIPNVKFEGLYHPILENPIANNFQIGEGKNMCFLTGANMSGKSTFLKSYGLAVYLAHVGFPVPAKNMKTTIFNGLITTINLSDNITHGYSHFYCEIKRIKEAAEMIKQNKKMIVIFDELFRGTNVKDATDASLMIILALSKIKKSVFLISTHITEIAENLKSNHNIFFSCFESKKEKETLIYSYKLIDGITIERFGMQIVKNEKIVELLEEIADNFTSMHYPILR